MEHFTTIIELGHGKLVYDKVRDILRYEDSKAYGGLLEIIETTSNHPDEIEELCLKYVSDMLAGSWNDELVDKLVAEFGLKCASVMYEADINIDKIIGE